MVCFHIVNVCEHFLRGSKSLLDSLTFTSEHLPWRVSHLFTKLPPTEEHLSSINNTHLRRKLQEQASYLKMQFYTQVTDESGWCMHGCG